MALFPTYMYFPLIAFFTAIALRHVHYVRPPLAGYIGRNNVWWIARKRAIGGYKFGSYGTIATPSPGVYAVGAILADLILAV